MAQAHGQVPTALRAQWGWGYKGQEGTSVQASGISPHLPPGKPLSGYRADSVCQSCLFLKTVALGTLPKPSALL